MRIDGVWLLCSDGIVRPVIRGEVLAADGAWTKVPFLLDIGADRTVLSANTLDDKGKALFRSQFAAVASPEALDMSVLGRDVTNLFAVIVDWPRQVVCMIGQRDEYAIIQR